MSEGNVTDANGPDGRRRGTRELVGLAPAVAAITLAALYVIGAIARLGELRGAGVDARDLLPLFGVQQLLARGVSVSLEALATILFAAVLLLGGLALTRIWPPKPIEGNTRRVMIGLTELMLLVVVLLGPITYLPSFVLFAILVPLAVALSYKPPTGVIVATAALIAAIAISLDAYFAPAKLPTATVQLANGQTRSGPFIAFAEGIWFLAAPGHRFVAIDERDIRSASIARRPRARRARSLLEIIIGRRFLPQPRY
jgi:hypothetical protein